MLIGEFSLWFFVIKLENHSDLCQGAMPGHFNIIVISPVGGL